MDFLLQNLFQKGFYLLMTTAKKFYVSSLLSHPRIQTWKQNLFVRFFCLGFFVWIHMYHQLLIFLSHFVTNGFYFRLRNPLIGILSIVFLLLYLRNSSCVTIMYHRRNLLQNVFFVKETLILYFHFILPFYQLNIHNNLLIFGVIHLFLQYF